MTTEAMCPSCGYSGLTLIEGNRLVCTHGGCRYEHLVTTTMPIIVITSPDPD
jgi:hypothetical protein